MGSQLTIRRSSLVVVGLITTYTLLTASQAAAVPAPPPAPTMPPPECTADAIAAETGMTLLPDVVCSAGFAMALAEPVPAQVPTPAPQNGSTTTLAPPVPCDQFAGCAEADIFHMTVSGWVYDGRHGSICAEDFDVAFMSPQTAAMFAPVCFEAEWRKPPIVRRGDAGTAVMYVQIALLALGYEVAVDGTYGHATATAITSLKHSYGLEPDGNVDAATHALLGTGPAVPGSPSPTTSVRTSTTTSTTSTTTTTTSTVSPLPSVTPSTPRPCTAEAITADTGIPVAALQPCAAGWALAIPAASCQPHPDEPDAECESADAFYVTPSGWMHAGEVYPFCADHLASGSGMSIYTALSWGPVCGDTPLPDRTIVTPGSRGPEVERLQIALVAVGYPIGVDGEYGPRTESAVRDFQQRNGLEVDGIAGSDTQITLGM